MTPADVLARARRAWVPPPRLRLSEWVEREMILPGGVSALPGPVRLWPFQREIADAMGDPGVERVTVVKPVRVGFTTLLTSVLGAYVANDPAPVLFLLPTEADCRDYVVSDVEPIFAATPALCRALGDDVEEGERNTLLSRRFPGGSLKVVAAKAPRNLRRHTARVLFIDEADGMEVTPEGSPIMLAERRTMSFPDRKIIMGSTPTHEATSHVLQAYARSDARVFEVPCPCCGAYFELMWDHIRWDRDGEGRHRPETAHAVCPSCGGVIVERAKGAMVEAGRWRATRPEVTGHAGFRLNALVSLHSNASWAKLVEEFLAAKDHPPLLQTFVNTILGQGWADDGEEMDEAALQARVEPWGLECVPADALVLTAGVDVQHDRLEATVLGWTEAGAMLVLGHHVIDGAWDDDDTWQELDEFLQARFPHERGGRIGIDAAAVDSGEGLTSRRVMAFCRPRARRRVMAIKGEDGLRRPLIERSRSKAGAGLWIVGSDAGKAQLLARISNPALVRFSRDLPPNWFDQLASERRVIRYVRGKPVHRFERVPGRRAEALDCVVYGMAARQVLTVDWDRRRDDASRREPVRTPGPAAREPGWLNVRENWL